MRIRHFVTNAVLFIIIAAMLAVCGGCGSDSSAAKPKIHLQGALHGELAAALTEQAEILSSGDQTGEILMISNANGIDAASSDMSRFKSAYENGSVVAVEHASASEVNYMLNGIGEEPNFSLPSGDVDQNVEIFAMARRGKDVFTFITRSDNNDNPVSTDMSGKVVIPEAENVVEEPRGYPETAESAEEDAGSDEMHQAKRAENFLNWAKNIDSQAASVASSKSQATGVQDGDSDITKLASAHIVQNDCSFEERNLIVTYTMYSCHSFKDGYDWFLVQMSSTLNPEKKYSKKWVSDYKWNGAKWHVDIVQGYVSSYNFDQSIGASPSTSDVLLYASTPENVNSAVSKTTGFSWNVGGSVGFSGLAATGSITGGISYSTSETITIYDYDIQNASVSASKSQAIWKYVFKRPPNGNKNWYCRRIGDAPLTSRSLLQPHCQWIWRVSKNYRDTNWTTPDSSKFTAVFKWNDGYSRSAFGSGWWVYPEGRQDTDTEHTNTLTIPLSLPPRIAVDNATLTFGAEATHGTFGMLSENNWTATSDSAWCSISQTSGDKTGESRKIINVDVDKNESGATRTAKINITDGKGASAVVEVLQSKY